MRFDLLDNVACMNFYSHDFAGINFCERPKNLGKSERLYPQNFLVIKYPNLVEASKCLATCPVLLSSKCLSLLCLEQSESEFLDT